MAGWPYALAPAVTALARQAGAVILAEQRAGVRTLAKPDGSPQSNADRAAELVIVAGLGALTSDIPVLAEESIGQAPPYDPARPFWLVDPLDGTRSFVAGDDDFSVNIALIRDGRPVLGALYGPARGELFWNDAAGAWRQMRDEPPAIIRTRPTPPEGLTMITSRRTRTGARLKSWMADETIAHEIMLSSALKFGYVAMGQADVYPRFGPTMEWDNAAGEAILHAAGGKVTTPDGQPLPYGQPHLMHHGLVARGT